MKIVRSMPEARRLARGLVGLVPTMGYFHEGHLALMEASVAACDTTVVSLFVNPLQFDDTADLARYPVDHDRDAGLAAGVGVDVLVIPPVEQMYAVPPLTRVVVAEISERMEGAHRPGHFEGVATVVAKLFAGLQPDRAYFGRKDAQQLAVVTRMALDLSFPLEVVGVPLIRDHDGLALSSRNVFLGGDDRAAALGLSAGLFAAADAAEAGTDDAASLERVVRDAAPGLGFEYIRLADAGTMALIDTVGEEAVLAVAGRVGRVRLIDNVRLIRGASGITADRGRRLPSPSTLLGAR